MKYGEKIKYIREFILPKRLGVKKISTYDLAEMLGVNQSFISHVENPKTGKIEKKFGRDITLRLADLSGIPLEAFERDDIDIIEAMQAAPTKELGKQLQDNNIDFLVLRKAVENTTLSKDEVLELIQIMSKKI